MPPTAGASTRQRLLADRRTWWLTGATVVAIATLAWILWPAPDPQPPRARQYLTYTACLLTAERGIAEPDAVPVWAGLQDASLNTRAKVQYLAITGPQTVDNGLPFLNSLGQTGCNLVLAAGHIPVATIDKGAATFPHTRFHPINGGTPQPNVAPITAHTDNEIRAAVRHTLQQAVAATVA